MQTCAVRFNRIVAVFVALMILCGTIAAYGDTYDKRTEENIPEGYELAAENDELSLYYSADIARIIVRNNKTGYLWASSFDTDRIPGGLTKAQKSEARSLLGITYTSIADFSSKSKTESLERLGYELMPYRKKGGFTYEIYVPKLDCSIELDFALDEYGLKVTVPDQGIHEAVKSAESIISARDEIAAEVAVQRSAYEKMKEAYGVSRNDKRLIDISIGILDKMEAELAGIKDAYGISSTAQKLSDFVDDINKKGYRTRSAMKLKIKIAQLGKSDSFAIVGLKLMPYFGACDDSTEGYVLFPDGCGAISEFKKDHGKYNSNYNASTYSGMITDIDRELNQTSIGLSNQTIPYFGIKADNNGMIAYVSSGQAMSDITFSPSGYLMPVSRTYAGFTYRNTVATSSINGEWQSGSDTMVFEETRLPFNAEVEYQFLDGDQADYSGMANTLRSYFVKEGILTKTKLISNGLPLAIDFLGVKNEKLYLFDKYVVATEFGQASEVAKILGDVPLICNYRGAFSKGFGVYPAGSDLSRKLGSKSELCELSSVIKASGGQLFLENNQILAQLEEKGYKESDLTIDNKYTVLRSKDSNSLFLFSPRIVNEKQPDMLDDYSTFGSTAAADEMIGSFIYPDYDRKNRTSRIETAELWKENLAQAKEKLGAVRVSLGNDYTFNRADWISGVPASANGYIYMDEEVPFYEMLTHGYIAETSTYNNEFHDRRLQLLRSIEYGLIPYYSLTVNSVDWKENGSFSSRFSEVYEDIVKEYNECESALGDVVEVPIVHHSVKKDLAEVVYDNGIRIIINYSDKDRTVDGITIQPMDFVKITGGEGDVNDQEKLKIKEIKAEARGGKERFSVYSSLAVWIFIILSVSIVVLCGISIFKHKRHTEL